MTYCLQNATKPFFLVLYMREMWILRKLNNLQLNNLSKQLAAIRVKLSIPKPWKLCVSKAPPPYQLCVYLQDKCKQGCRILRMCEL